jgi:hypothetical protein
MGRPRRESDQFGGRHPHWLNTVLRCFLRRHLAHRLTQPCVPRVWSEPRVQDHQEMKWTELLWRFHEPQGGILSAVYRLACRNGNFYRHMKVNQCLRSPSSNSQPRSLLFLKRPVAVFYRASVATPPALPVLYRLSRPFTQNPFSHNSNDVSFESRSEQPTALVHETICEQVHSRAANAMP